MNCNNKSSERCVYKLERMYYSLFLRIAERNIDVITRTNLIRNSGFPYSKEEIANEIIFVHIPKTGGNSIAKAIFGTGGRGHYSLAQYYRSNPTLFRRSFKFGITRNPWDRIVSSFHYLKQGGMTKSDKEFGDTFLANLNFGSFIVKLSDDNEYLTKVLRWIHFRPQIDFVQINNQTTMDYLGKLESIDEALNAISEIVKRNVVIKKFNASNHEDYRKYYKESQLVDIVENIYKRDVQQFGYCFEK
ncbi:sulfotransferase family 2 domain-containing protein [Hoeflea sp. CAU 1731]